MEAHNYDLARSLAKMTDLRVIANRHGKKALPWFLPWAMVQCLITAGRYDAVLFGDAVLAPVGWILRLFYRAKPLICMVHGLDITYSAWLYQQVWVRLCLGAMTMLVAVSRATSDEAIRRGVAAEKIVCIPNGIEPQEHQMPVSRTEIETYLHQDLSGKVVLLTVGRLVERKGVAWFVSEVMPRLAENILYVVAGSGPELDRIRDLVDRAGLTQRVRLIGHVDNQTKDLLLATADLFIQPNVAVPGDMEGFGIAVLEAGLRGLPVVASRLEGLQDAVHHGCNGLLVTPHDAQSFVEAISTLIDNDSYRKELSEKARRLIHDEFRWEQIARRYERVLADVRDTPVTVPRGTVT